MPAEPCLLLEMGQNPSQELWLASCPSLSWGTPVLGMKRTGCYQPEAQRGRLTHSSEEQDKEQGAQHQRCVPCPLGGVHSRDAQKHEDDGL